jgi:hypothetical protein
MRGMNVLITKRRFVSLQPSGYPSDTLLKLHVLITTQTGCKMRYGNFYSERKMCAKSENIDAGFGNVSDSLF